jgi:hypothetical protein
VGKGEGTGEDICLTRGNCIKKGFSWEFYINILGMRSFLCVSMAAITFQFGDQHGLENYRRARFFAGWYHGANGEVYAESALHKMTWTNLGYRLGAIFGNAEDGEIDEVFQWCLRLWCRSNRDQCS